MAPIDKWPVGYRLYGKLFPEIVRAPFPLDVIRQLGESEFVDEAHVTMAGLTAAPLKTVEECIMEIARPYRRMEDCGVAVVLPPELLTDSTSPSSSARRQH